MVVIRKLWIFNVGIEIRYWAFSAIQCVASVNNVCEKRTTEEHKIQKSPIFIL